MLVLFVSWMNDWPAGGAYVAVSRAGRHPGAGVNTLRRWDPKARGAPAPHPACCLPDICAVLKITVV